MGPKWLKDAVFYEIYPQSFLDTNNDGIADDYEWLRDENGKSVYFMANTRHHIIAFGPGDELALPIRLIKK